MRTCYFAKSIMNQGAKRDVNKSIIMDMCGVHFGSCRIRRTTKDVTAEDLLQADIVGPTE